MTGTTTESSGSSAILDPTELDELNKSFADRDPRNVLAWIADSVREDRAILSSTFGVGGTILIHLLSEVGIRLPIVFIDTLYHFPETLEHAERMRERYDLDLRVHRPAPSREAFEAVHGPRLWERDPELYHRLTKQDPMRKALQAKEAWITGRRRDQSPSRANLQVLERGTWLKVNPLAGWTRERAWDFVRRHELPYHPLHDRGYPSVGDAPLTTPVNPGEHERAGRWRGSERLECGLHNI